MLARPAAVDDADAELLTVNRIQQDEVRPRTESLGRWSLEAMEISAGRGKLIASDVRLASPSVTHTDGRARRGVHDDRRTAT